VTYGKITEQTVDLSIRFEPLELIGKKILLLCIEKKTFEALNEFKKLSKQSFISEELIKILENLIDSHTHPSINQEKRVKMIECIIKSKERILDLKLETCLQWNALLIELSRIK